MRREMKTFLIKFMSSMGTVLSTEVKSVNKRGASMKFKREWNDGSMPDHYYKPITISKREKI